MVEEVNAHLNDDYGELSRSILQLSHEEFEDTLSKHEEFKRSQQKRILNIRLKLAGLAKSVPTEHLPRPMTAMRTVEMEKCQSCIRALSNCLAALYLEFLLAFICSSPHIINFDIVGWRR